MSLYELNTWLLAAGIALPGALFLVLYLIFVRIRTWAGWNVVALTAGLVALALMAIARRLYGEWEWYQESVAVALILAALSMWQRVIQLVRGPTFNFRPMRRYRRK